MEDVDPVRRLPKKGTTVDFESYPWNIIILLYIPGLVLSGDNENINNY